MSRQNINIARDVFENNILDMEKHYFQKLKDVIESEEFIQDLLLIEKEIREKYSQFETIWNLKNKIKVVAERLVRHHVYIKWNKSICGIYPSPVSSDLGIKVEDAIICIDVKTIDMVGNSGDVRSTQVEKNQTSFNNSNYKGIQTESHLHSVDDYSGLPILSFIVKIIYIDNSHSFKLSRNKQSGLVVVCIPNGKLSKLFDYNIIENFKTFDYYTEKDNAAFKKHIIPTTYKSKEEINKYVENYCINVRGFTAIDIAGKTAYYDSINRITWWLVSSNKEKSIMAVKSGSSVRYKNIYLTNRFDSSNNPWDGYYEVQLPDPMK